MGNVEPDLEVQEMVLPEPEIGGLLVAYPIKQPSCVIMRAVKRITRVLIGQIDQHESVFFYSSR